MTTPIDALLARIDARAARVAVLGLGYVGLPLARAFLDGGLHVLGFDVDRGKVESLSAGRVYLRHLGDDFAARLNATGRFDPTHDPARLAEADALCICVPTPLGDHLEPDLSYVERTTDAITRTLRTGQLIVLESTTYPGTTRDVLLPRLAQSGLACGRDFFLAFSPEREEPGNTAFPTTAIPKLVGGVDAPSTRAAVALYRAAFRTVVEVDSPEIAEAAKLLENIFRAVNIALVNELKVVLAAMGIDIWQVIEAARTKPFGFMPFYPGPGLGGHCIPIDPFYLTWKAREAGVASRFIELAGVVNAAMPDYVVDAVVRALNDHARAVRGSRILVLGLAYKPDIDDVRESPSFVLIEKLAALGATVDYSDPHVPATHRMRRRDLGMRSVELTPAAVAGYDAIVVATAHRAFPYAMLAEHARLVIDTRNAFGAFRDAMGSRLRRA